MEEKANGHAKAYRPLQPEIRPKFRRIHYVKIKDMLDIAGHIVEQKAGNFEPDKFEDWYQIALVDLINQKHDAG